MAAVATRGGRRDRRWASGVDGVKLVLEARGTGIRGKHDRWTGLFFGVDFGFGDGRGAEAVAGGGAAHGWAEAEWFVFRGGIVAGSR